MQRLLMRWYLYANRQHNARILVYVWQRDNEWGVMECCFLYWKTWTEVHQHSRCHTHSTDIAVKCGDRLTDALTTELMQVVTSSLSAFPVAHGHPQLDSPRIIDLNIQDESILTKFLRCLCTGEDTTTSQQGLYHPNTRHNLLVSWGRSQAWRTGVRVSVENEVSAPSRAPRGKVSPWIRV